MLEVEVTRAGGTYLYCDTDSLAIVASEEGGPPRIPGAEGKRVLTWGEIDRITAKFQALNPYDENVVPDQLNLTDDNFVCKCLHELKTEHDEVGVCNVRGCDCKVNRKCVGTYTVLE